MKSLFTVEELVPHSGLMSLLSEITGYGDDWLSAQVNITPDSMFADARGVPAWVGLEYMAQAIGAYAGLQERLQGQQPRLGFLLGTRKYSAPLEYFPVGSVVQVKATRNMQAENGLCSFDCMLWGERFETSARLSIFQPQEPEQFLQDARQ